MFVKVARYFAKQRGVAAMVGKGDQERITDTLTLIQNAPDLDLVIRQQICTWVSNLYPRLTSAERQAYHSLSQSMSVTAHIAAGIAKGDEQQRAKRRAIVLLWKAIGKVQSVSMVTDQQQVAAAMTMPITGLDAALSDAIIKAAVVATPGGAQAVMQDLELHPVRFLNKHRLLIKGTPAGGDRLSTAPTGNYQNVLTFYFQYTADRIDRFVMTTSKATSLGEARTFTTVSVPAVHWSQVPGIGVAVPYNFGGILGCEVTGANFMVTTQFTGCAFSWTNNGATLRASHISPSGGGPGTYPGGGIALAQRLITNGAMANAPGTALSVFGSGAGNAPVVGTGNPFYPTPVTGWASIFGLTKGGGWRFYLQVVDINGNIQEARRIL